ncbi:MAG: ATP-binding protein [Nitrospirota bacterium]
MKPVHYINRKLNLRAKISLVIIAILLAFGIGLSLAISNIASDALLNESKKRGVASGIYLSSRISEPILTMDFLQMKNTVDEVVRGSKDISYAFVLDRHGEPLVHTFTGGFPVALKQANQVADGETYRMRLLSTGSELIYDVAVPVLVGKDRLGTARVGMSRAHVQQVVSKLLWAISLSTGVGILIAGFVSTALARTMTKRIRLLHHSAEEIVKGNLDISVSPELKQQCWEMMHCTKKACPAYGNTRQRCWYLVGTMCQTCIEKNYEDKIRNCFQCKVYKSNTGDEIQDLTEFFTIMALILRDRLQALLKTEADLKQQQQLFRTILDVTPDSVSLQDRSFRFQAVNKAFCRMAEKSEEEIIGKTDADLFSPELAEVNRRENLHIVETGQPLSAERKTRKAGTIRWFHLVKTPVFDANGAVVGILCNSTDITEIKRLHEQIIRSQKMESLGQLSAGVAHEINTPLGIILGHTQLLLEDTPPGTEMHETLLTIEKYARISKKIVSDLLHFARHTESIKKPTDVNAILEQVLAIVEHTFRLERIVIQRHLASGLPLVFGDQEKLEQVFMNLLHNAYDAIGSDGRILVQTSYDERAREVVISIADTGHGIPPKIKDKLFDPFFSTKGVGRGTGLGLSVTFGIIKDHEGKIDFESPASFGNENGEPLPEGASEKRRGSVFTVRLPAYAIHETAKGGEIASNG